MTCSWPRLPGSLRGRSSGLPGKALWVTHKDAQSCWEPQVPSPPHLHGREQTERGGLRPGRVLIPPHLPHSAEEIFMLLRTPPLRPPLTSPEQEGSGDSESGLGLEPWSQQDPRPKEWGVHSLGHQDPEDCLLSQLPKGHFTYVLRPGGKAQKYSTAMGCRPPPRTCHTPGKVPIIPGGLQI